MDLPEEVINDLQQFVGKYIEVEGDGGVRRGTCQFVGPNPFFPSWGLQVTLDRTPVTNVKIKSIREYTRMSMPWKDKK